MQPLFLFKLAGIPFFSFTTLAAAGFALALAGGVAAWRRAGHPADEAFALAAWMLALAILGGRAVHVLINLDYFLERPAQLLWFADGGLSFAGVAGGALAGLAAWRRRTHYACPPVLDLLALPLLVLASLAWLGAFMHGSQYGAPAESAFGLELRDNYGVIQVRWPAPLWAAAWSAVCGLYIAFARRRMRAPGALAAVAVGVYAAGMFLIDFARGDSTVHMWGLRLTQWLYLVACGVAILHLVRMFFPFDGVSKKH